MVDAIGQLTRIFVGRAIGDRFSIKYDYVGEPALLKLSSIFAAKASRWSIAQLGHSLFQCEQLVVSDTGSQDARCRSVHPRVDLAVREVDAIRPHQITIMGQPGMDQTIIPVMEHKQNCKILLD